MKKYLLFLVMALFLLPGLSRAQYSDATVTGPWIVGGEGNAAYIIFDGSGTVTELGLSGDSLHPVGTYSISASGVVTGTVYLLPADGGTNYINGNMASDSFANFLLDSVQQHYLYKVTNPAALEGTWSGSITDSSTQATRSIQFTVNSAGTITSATGITLIAGKIFEARDTFAAYLTTSDTACTFQFINYYGLYSGNTLTGLSAKLGKDGSTCTSDGNGQFTRVSSAVPAVSAETGFSVYPNPFTDNIDVSVRNPGNKMQADIFDILGRKVCSKECGSMPNIMLNLSDLSSGVYMLRLNSDGKMLTRRIVKN